MKKIHYTSRHVGNTWSKTWSNPTAGWEFSIGYIGNIRPSFDFRVDGKSFRMNLGRFFAYRMVLPF
ncbi:MAG: hypothetical protein PHO36_15550 [Parabacteroides sp.]|nr:hypothetical protein [Parabacteroides sp.]